MNGTYTTVQGDMWDSIAYAQLGDVSYTDQLMRLNRQYIGYYTFPAGIVLKLPERKERTAETLPPWKRVTP